MAKNKLPAPAIGIDLGTTFSAVAVYQNGRPTVIPNLISKDITPSLIFYPKSGSVDPYVGEMAAEQSVTCITNFLYDMKRIIGRKIDDVYIQKIIASKNYKYDIVCGDSDKAAVKIIQANSDTDRIISPENACSEIIKYLKKSAEDYLGCQISEAVISVPAHFSNAQRKATKHAAELVDLKVLKLITEPVAAAISYSFDKKHAELTFLVFDWGGGTLDVSVIQVSEKKFKVKSVEGDSFLGGRDIDELLVNHFKNKIKVDIDETLDDRSLYRLTKMCQRIKVYLSDVKEYSCSLEVINGNDKNYLLSITREEFDKICDILFKRAINLVELSLKNIGLPKEKIDEILLVGGSSKIPKIRSMLANFFGKSPKTHTKPEEAVVKGAALQAKLLTDKFDELETYQITEVTPLSLGFRLYGDLMRFVVKKNSPLPYTSKTVMCETSYNNQTGCTFSICEGERKNCKYNNVLGKIIIHNLPPKKIGEVKFKLQFHLDEDGILTVTTKDTTNTNAAKLVVTIGEFRLCENKIKNIIMDAEKHKLEDEKFEKFIYDVCDKKRKCSQILYHVKNLPDDSIYLVKERCEKFIKICDEITFEEFENLEKEYLIFVKEIRPKIKNFIDVNLDINLDNILKSLQNTDALDKLVLDKDFTRLIEQELEQLQLKDDKQTNKTEQEKNKNAKNTNDK